FPDGHRVLVVLDHQLDGLADLVGEHLPADLRRRRQPGALNGVAVLGVAAPGGQRERKHQGERDEGLEQHWNLLKGHVQPPGSLQRPDRLATVSLERVPAEVNSTKNALCVWPNEANCLALSRRTTKLSYENACPRPHAAGSWTVTA